MKPPSLERLLSFWECGARPGFGLEGTCEGPLCDAAGSRGSVKVSASCSLGPIWFWPEPYPPFLARAFLSAASFASRSDLSWEVFTSDADDPSQGAHHPRRAG